MLQLSSVFVRLPINRRLFCLGITERSAGAQYLDVLSLPLVNGLEELFEVVFPRGTSQSQPPWVVLG